MLSDIQLLKFVNAYIDCFAIVAFVLGSFAYKYYKQLIPIGFVLLLTVFNNQLSYYWAYYFKSNVQLYHIFNPVQLLLLGWFFYINFENTFFKNSIKYIVAVSILFSIVNTIFFQHFSVYPSNFLLLETLVLILWSTFLFIEKLDAPAGENIFTNPVFITALGILCFNLFSFLFFLLTNYMFTHNISQSGNIYLIIYFSNFIYYPILFVANIYSLKK